MRDGSIWRFDEVDIFLVRMCNPFPICSPMARMVMGQAKLVMRLGGSGRSEGKILLFQGYSEFVLKRTFGYCVLLDVEISDGPRVL